MNNTEQTLISSINFHIGSEQCSRDYMEDFYVLTNKTNFKMFSICDGHGGDYVSSNISNIIHTRIINCLNLDLLDERLSERLYEELYEEEKFEEEFFNEEKIKNKLTELCLQIDSEFSENSKAFKCGTTLITIIITNKYIITLNIGDSCVIFNKRFNTLFKNTYHTPSNKLEEKRILLTSKIIDKRIDGKINISRTLGDFIYKIKDKNPIISNPDIFFLFTKDFIESNYKPWILLCSDGMFCNFDEDFVHRVINRMYDLNFSTENIVNLFLTYFKLINNSDNVTIILITFYKILHDEKDTKTFLKLKKNIEKNVVQKIKKKISKNTNLNLLINETINNIYFKIKKKDDVIKFILILLKSEIYKNVFKELKEF